MQDVYVNNIFFMLIPLTDLNLNALENMKYIWNWNMQKSLLKMNHNVTLGSLSLDSLL